MPASASDRTVSDEISSYWVNFAKTGDPNGSGLPQWPAFTNTSAQVMNLDDPSKADRCSESPETRSVGRLFRVAARG